MRAYIVALLLMISSLGYSQTKTFDIADCKFKLTKYLLSCNSFISTAITDEKTDNERYYLGDIAASYYRMSEKQFANLKLNNGLNDTTLINNIESILMAYNKIVNDKRNYLKPAEIGFVLELLNSEYKLKILPKIWCK